MTHTMTELMEMSKEELRSEVGKTIGYQWIMYSLGLSVFYCILEPHKEEPLGKIDNPTPTVEKFYQCPDWPSYICSAYELEEGVPDKCEYIGNLVKVIEAEIGYCTAWETTHATPRQRCIAYILTVDVKE